MRSNESNKNNKKVILQGSDLVIKNVGHSTWFSTYFHPHVITSQLHH